MFEILQSEKFNNVKIVKPDVFYDHRGEYVETWNEELTKELGIEFKQDSFSYSIRHVLRGLHGDYETWKLVQCLHGNILLCVLDYRESSNTYLQYEMFTINDKNKLQILIPPGFANGHLVMSNSAIFHYKQSTLYLGGENQFTIKWDSLDIPWPINYPILSKRDLMR